MLTPDPEVLQKEVAAQARELLQEQLDNLSARLFEAGKKADQQLTTWVAFAALTPLILFGASEDTTVGDVKLAPVVAGSVTYVLSCVFYYRAILSIKALEYWRTFLKQQRRVRFALLYQTTRNDPTGEVQIEREMDAYVAEYPGYIACSVLVKSEALNEGTLAGKYIAFVHSLIILGFGVSPYLLAASMLYASWFSWWSLATVVIGLMITLSGNLVLQQHRVES